MWKQVLQKGSVVVSKTSVTLDVTIGITPQGESIIFFLFKIMSFKSWMTCHSGSTQCNRWTLSAVAINPLFFFRNISASANYLQKMIAEFGWRQHVKKEIYGVINLLTDLADFFENHHGLSIICESHHTRIKCNIVKKSNWEDKEHVSNHYAQDHDRRLPDVRREL